MKRLAAGFAFIAVVLLAYGQAQETERPRILGIDHVSFYTTQPDGVNKLYGGVLGFASAAPVESRGTARYTIRTDFWSTTAMPKTAFYATFLASVSTGTVECSLTKRTGWRCRCRTERIGWSTC